jgi:hypothetical protein
MKRILLTSMAIIFLMAMPVRVLAQSLIQGDTDSIYGDTVWYQQDNGTGACSVSVDVSLSGNDNIQKA